MSETTGESEPTSEPQDAGNASWESPTPEFPAPEFPAPESPPSPESSTSHQSGESTFGGGGGGGEGKGKSRRTKTIVGLVVLLALLVGGGTAALLLGGEDDPTAAELFASAKKFVAAAGTATITGEGTIESGVLSSSGSQEGAGGAAGSGMVQRMKFKGQADWPDRSLMRIDSGTSGASEVLVIKGDAYVRGAQKLSDLDEAKWAEQRLPSGVVKPESEGPILDLSNPASGGPLTLGKLLAVAKAPESFTRDGSAYVLTLKLDPKDVIGGEDTSGLKLDKFAMILRLEKSGKILSYTLDELGTVSAFESSESYKAKTTLRFAWGEKVSITVPSSKDIDATPEMNEEAISKFDAAPVLVPRSIPSGWTMTYADVVPSEETAESCDEVSIDYANADDPETGYLNLYVFNADCAGLDLTPPPGADDFRPGKASEGYVVGSAEDGWIAQIVVGSTVIQADTDLNPDELAQVLNNLSTFDLKAAPGEIEGIGTPTRMG